MSSCFICGNRLKQHETKQFSDSVGNPAKSISNIVEIDILKDCNKSFDYTSNSELCRKCYQKIANFYKSIQVAEQFKQELLELMIATNEARSDIKEEAMPTIKVEENVFVNSLDFVDSSGWNDDNNPKEDILSTILDEPDDIKVEVNVSAGDSDDDFAVEDNKSSESEDNEHTKKSKVKKKYVFVERKCTQCDEIIKNKSHYQTHMHKFHFSGYVCDHCGQTLRSYTGFKHHLLTHDGEKKFVCNICGNKFTNEMSLKLHLTYHDGVTPFKCEICSKAFAHKVALRKHKAIHDDSTKKYPCTECEAKFRSKYSLMRHMKGHTGATPHCCHICGKCFTQRDNMKRHIKEHEQPGSTKVRRYRCKKCSRTFSNTDNYKKHCEEANCEPKQVKIQNNLTPSMSMLFNS